MCIKRTIIKLASITPQFTLQSMHWCYSCSQCPLWVQRIIVAFHVNPPQLSNYSICHWFSVDLVPTLPGVRCQVLDSQWPNQDGDCHGGFCLIAHPPASSEQICREQLWNFAVESPLQVVRKWSGASHERWWAGGQGRAAVRGGHCNQSNSRAKTMVAVCRSDCCWLLGGLATWAFQQVN